MDTPNIPAVNATPDMGNLSSVKTEGAQVKPVNEVVNKVSENKSETLTTKENKAEVKEAIQKIKLGEKEYTLAELQSKIEKAEGADKKFLEAAKARKEAMRVFKMAKENPKEFLKITGQDPKKFAYDEVAEDVKKQLRDPKEVALEEAEKRIKEYEQKEETQKKEREAIRQEKEAKALEQRFHTEIIEALEAFPELPKNAYTVAQLARAIDSVRSKHGVLLTAKEVAPLVVKDIRNTINGLVKGATPEMLIQLIGQEGVDALLKHSMSKLKDPLKNGQGEVRPGEEAPKAKKRWKSSHDYWKSIDTEAKRERGEL